MATLSPSVSGSPTRSEGGGVYDVNRQRRINDLAMGGGVKAPDNPLSPSNRPAAPPAATAI